MERSGDGDFCLLDKEGVIFTTFIAQAKSRERGPEPKRFHLPSRNNHHRRGPQVEVITHVQHLHPNPHLLQTTSRMRPAASISRTFRCCCFHRVNIKCRRCLFLISEMLKPGGKAAAFGVWPALSVAPSSATAVSWGSSVAALRFSPFFLLPPLLSPAFSMAFAPCLYGNGNNFLFWLAFLGFYFRGPEVLKKNVECHMSCSHLRWFWSLTLEEI